MDFKSLKFMRVKADHGNMGSRNIIYRNCRGFSLSLETINKTSFGSNSV